MDERLVCLARVAGGVRVKLGAIRWYVCGWARVERNCKWGRWKLRVTVKGL